MRIAPIGFISQASNRFRKIFDEGKVISLAASIQRSGLINLPVCRQLEDGTLELVAGERRKKAIEYLHSKDLSFHYMGTLIEKGNFPFALLQELPELQAREIELEENIERADLTWQEVATATAMLHGLRTRQDPTWTVRQTAEEVAVKRGEVSIRPTTMQGRITLAQHLAEPTIAAAKSEKEALKELCKILERTFTSELGKRVSLESFHDKFTVELVDALEGLGRLANASVDCILTDPPYGVDSNKFNADTALRHGYDDDPEVVIQTIKDVLPEFERVMKVQSHLYMFCDFELFPAWKHLIQTTTKLTVWPRPILWIKDVGHIPKPHFGPRYCYECILFANKGERCTIQLDSDVISVPAVKNKIHAAEKPIELLTNLLSRTVYPGNLILDPFCGSGSVFLAAAFAKCQAVGFDNDPACVEMAAGRIRQLEWKDESSPVSK